MELQSYRILFGNPSNTYFAGQTVSGNIEIELRRPKQIAGIYLHIKGEAIVHWSDGQETYSAQEEYLKINQYCLGNEHHAQVVLPVGTNSYPFSFALPHTLPSSFEGQHGNIRYTVKVIIERPWKWNHEIKTAFTVISPYDLNRFPDLQLQAKVMEENYPCCCNTWITSTVVMMVQRTGYVCGEKIPVLIELDNPSSADISSVTLTFQQSTSYFAQNPKRHQIEDVLVLEKSKLGSVMANNSKSLTHMILIPPLPPSYLGNCSIIKTDYQIRLEVIHIIPNQPISLSIPITIGTTPLTDEESRIAPPDSPPPDYNTSLDGNSGPSAKNWADSSTTPTAPRQMFVEYRMFKTQSIHDIDDNEYTMYNNNSRSFAPNYPVYNPNFNTR